MQNSKPNSTRTLQMLRSKVLQAVIATVHPIAGLHCLNSRRCTAEKNYLLAIELYGQAIDSNPLNAVYHANRAFAHIRMETYGSAMEDATEAIAIDPKYVKVRSVTTETAALTYYDTTVIRTPHDTCL